MRNLIAATLVAAALVAVPATSTATPTDQPTWFACQYEDSVNCVWDAKHAGNGSGTSFVVTKRGKVYPVPHRVAHALLATANTYPDYAL